jgi:hypothetical protein
MAFINIVLYYSHLNSYFFLLIRHEFSVVREKILVVWANFHLHELVCSRVVVFACLAASLSQTGKN